MGSENPQNRAVYDQTQQQPLNGTMPNSSGMANPGQAAAQNYPQTVPNVAGSTNPEVAAAYAQGLQAGQGTTASTNSAGGQTQDQYSSAANPNPNTVKNVAEDLRTYAPEINWDYAIIQRVNPQDLSSKLIWMSPRKAILDRDEQANLELQPGDIITIFSQRDISVPETERSQYVIVEGEVVRPGVYKLEINETLRSVLQLSLIHIWDRLLRNMLSNSMPVPLILARLSAQPGMASPWIRSSTRFNYRFIAADS